jgi:hypothetical protein
MKNGCVCLSFAQSAATKGARTRTIIDMLAPIATQAVSQEARISKGAAWPQTGR